MGLDMYLDKHVYIGANWEHRNATGGLDITMGDLHIQIPAKEISSVICPGAYWRKANQIHRWFVENVQDGTDDCGTYYVSWEQIQELKYLCLRALAKKNPEILPPQGGFFFGSTDIDKWYWNDLQATVDQLEKLDEGASYYYHSSW